MNSNESAFNDALVAVATANTATYLINRIRHHPLVQYLDSAFSEKQLSDKLLLELGKFDGSTQNATIVLLLIQALVNKSNDKPIAAKVREAILKSNVSWARDLLATSEFPRSHSATTSAEFKLRTEPKTTVSRKVSHSWQSFSFNGGVN